MASNAQAGQSRVVSIGVVELASGCDMTFRANRESGVTSCTKFSGAWHFCQFVVGLWVLGLLLVLVGCATPSAQQTFVDEPRAGPVPAGSIGRPVVALVLSGGSARGFAHIGVIKALEQAGIAPDLVLGSSVGSIVAAAYASGMNARELVEAARAVDSATLTDFTIPDLGQPFMRGELGFVRGQQLRPMSRSW